MKWISRCQLIGITGGMLGVFLLGPNACPGGHPDHPYRYSDVDMPVSLAVGTVRTPEFPVVSEWYDIMVQVENLKKPKKPMTPEKLVPFQQMWCMMGVTSSPLELKDCSSNDPLLRADWTVWDGEHKVDQGSSTTSGYAKFENRYIYKFLGSFPAKAGKKYIVEVKFTKDGTPLNEANPHLIVLQHRDN